jgi:hypothetical protein
MHVVPQRYRLFVDGGSLAVVTDRERKILNIDHLCGIVFRPIRAMGGCRGMFSVCNNG